MNSARKLLSGNSKQLQFYEDASSLIAKEFGSVFGQLNDLQLASQEVIDSIDIQKGVYDMQAFERWQAKAKPLLIEDHTPASSTTGLEAGAQAAPVFFQN
jgi:hypothetical protein